MIYHLSLIAHIVHTLHSEKVQSDIVHTRISQVLITEIP